jgi:hypothetical protein
MRSDRDDDPPSRVPAAASTRHPRRDRLFTVVFIVVLVVMGGLAFRPRASATLDAENRTMAPWPTGALTRGFPTAFEQAFADRFGGRDALLRWDNRVRVRLFGVPAASNVLIGRDGWLYFMGEEGPSFDRYYRGTLPVSDAQLRAVVTELARRNAFLAANGIAYVVTIAPDKSTIYPEHLPRWATQLAARTPLDRLVDAIRAEGSVRFVDLREPLRAAKSRQRVYFSTDSHWNLLGAAVAYGEIIREIAAALPSKRMEPVAAVLPPYVPGVDVYRGDLARLTGDPASFSEPDYAPLRKVLAAPQTRCAKRIDAEQHNGFEWYACDRPGLPRAVAYRDSMAIPLIPLLAENFSQSIYVGSRQLDPAFVLREHPDVVIEEMVERALLAPAAAAMPPAPATR